MKKIIFLILLFILAAALVAAAAGRGVLQMPDHRAAPALTH